MGKITLHVEGSTVGNVADGKGIIVSREVSEQDSARLIEAFAYKFQNEFNDGQGNRRTPSVEEVVEKWFDQVILVSTSEVNTIEGGLAAERAREAIQPIVVTSVKER